MKKTVQSIRLNLRIFLLKIFNLKINFQKKVDENKHNDVQSIISNTVEELFNEKKFDSKRRAFYLNSGN